MPLNADLELARRFVETHPPTGEILHVALVGAHAYGFPSADSDLDLKGMHLAPTTALLGLARPVETHDVLQVWRGIEHDLTTHEAGKALALLLRGDGNVLERLMSPVQLFETADLAELQALARGAMSRRFYDHYRGYFGGMCREHRRAPRTKTMLYAYRVALTGIHLLETGELEMDVSSNALAHGFDVAALIERKRDEAERGPLPEALDAAHRRAWPELEARLERARDRSALPDEPGNAAAIDAWLIERRQRALPSIRR